MAIGINSSMNEPEWDNARKQEHAHRLIDEVLLETFIKDTRDNLDKLISRTPTGDIRNRLTEINILVMGLEDELSNRN